MGKSFAQGLEELEPKLGLLVWHFANTKKFEPGDFEVLLRLLPRENAGLTMRHVVEVRHPNFVVPEFPALCAKYGMASPFNERKVLRWMGLSTPTRQPMRL